MGDVGTFGEMQGLDRRQELSVRALVAVLATDALYNITPNKWMDADLEHLQVHRQLRYVFASAKASAAAGLMLRHRSPHLARLAARGLVAYFILAIGAHVRIRDEAWRYGLAVAMLGWAGVTLHRLSPTQNAGLSRSTVLSRT